MKIDAQTYRNTVLLSEYSRVCSAIQTIEAQMDKLLNVGVALVTFGAAVGIAQQVAAVFFVLPIALIAVTLYTTLMFYYLQRLGGYKQHIEELINEAIEEELLIWELLAASGEKSNTTRVSLLLAYATIAIAIIAISFLQIYAGYGAIVLACLILVMIVFTPLLFQSSRELIRVYSNTYDLSKTLYRRQSTK
jgi:hypothetical protein